MERENNGYLFGVGPFLKVYLFFMTFLFKGVNLVSKLNDT